MYVYVCSYIECVYVCINSMQFQQRIIIFPYYLQLAKELLTSVAYRYIIYMANYSEIWLYFGIRTKSGFINL